MLKFMLKEKRGLALIETLPLLFMLVLLFGFSIGFFNIIHTGILHSIAARNYTFETLRYKSNALYFRNTQSHYLKKEVRFHTIQREGLSSNDMDFIPTVRSISMFKSQGRRINNDDRTHQQDIDKLMQNRRFKKKGSNPVWLRIGYGICINSSCGS